jgi:glycine hydroxymethyltransferase
MQTSGIRLGTPAVTTRGFGEAEVELVAELIAECLRAEEDPAVMKKIEEQVRALTASFPVPGLDQSRV